MNHGPLEPPKLRQAKAGPKGKLPNRPALWILLGRKDFINFLWQQSAGQELRELYDFARFDLGRALKAFPIILRRCLQCGQDMT